jgi:hypothetical protein
MTRASQRVAKEIADVLERDALGGYRSARANPSDTHMPVWESELRRWLLLLAPPRKKAIRRKPSKSRATVKELDALCREVVFKRDDSQCRRCGKPAVDWSHVYSRRYKWLRWDLDNSCAMCKGCHLWWHHKPIESAAWWSFELGDDKFHALRLRAAKPRKTDPELVRAYLMAEKGKL